MIKSEYAKMGFTANVEEIDKAIAAIYSAFVWGKTTQGHAYWANVIKKLNKIKAQAEGNT